MLPAWNQSRADVLIVTSEHWLPALRFASSDFLLRLQRSRGDLRDVQQLRRRLRHVCERIAEHGVAERAGSPDNVRSSRDELFGAFDADAFAFLLAEECQPTAGPATKRTLARSRRIAHFAKPAQHLARSIIDAAITSQITRVVIHDFLAVLRWKLVLMARQKFGVMLDRRRVTVFLPIGTNSPHAMRADRDNLLHLALLEHLQIVLRQFPKRQIVAQSSRRIARAALFPQH